MPGSLRNLFSLSSIFLFFLFVAFSYLVAKELFIQFDFDTTVKMQDRLDERWIGPFSILSVIGTLEITGLAWLALVVVGLLARSWKFLGALILLPISQIVELYGKLFLLHPGPPFLFFKTHLPFQFPSGFVHTDYSYPSGHSIRTTFLVTVALFFVTFKLKGIVRLASQGALLLFLGVMLVSRIYLGEHWTTDVIGGTLLGTSFGIVAGLAFLTRKRGTTQKSQQSRPEQEK